MSASKDGGNGNGNGNGNGRAEPKSLGQLLVVYFVLYPFLFVVGCIDVVLGLFLPYKYDYESLPDKNATLSALSDSSDTKSPYVSTLSSELIRIDDPKANLYDEFAKVYKQFADKQTMGVREIISIDDEKQPNGKVFKKFSLGNYQWLTYEQIHTRITHISNGLLKLGIRSGADNAVMFAETRPEWLQTAFACFRIKCPVVTLYATLGVDALAFGINESKSRFAITSSEQLPKLQKILARVPALENIVVFTDKHTDKFLVDFKKANADNLKLNVFTLGQVEEIGAKMTDDVAFTAPGKDDLAVIMYTSGSTGNPKGVMMSHGNLLASVRAVNTRLDNLNSGKDRIIAYLPLAHVLELVAEMLCLLNGVSIGYSTPQTIADTSTAIKRGQKGDLRVLKPTIMIAVPIILERLSKTVYEKLSTTSVFKQTLFKKAYEQKLRRFRRGSSTRLLDRILFKRISSAVLGGKVRVVIAGSALLSKEVHEFVQVCLGPLVQAYGLTETCGAGTTQLPNQTDTETVGSVVPCCEVRLADWAEAGYRTTDKPNARGEIYIGGECVTLGYYNMPEQTAKDYSYINGVRYFATGDIGEMLPSGNLRIIDRKKDLVKLSGGEYVSLNKIESIVKLMPVVDNVCVVADSYQSYCVALVCPNGKQLKAFMEKQGEEVAAAANDSSEKLVADMCARLEANNGKLAAQLTKAIVDFCLSQGVERAEIPARVKFVKEVWMPDTGLVTDSLKLKRKEIEKFYAADIKVLYK